MVPMPASKYRVKLNLADVRALRRAYEQLAAIKGMLMQTNWQASPACQLLVDQVAAVVAGVYNKGEVMLPRSEWLGPAETPPPAPASPDAPDPAFPVSDAPRDPKEA